MQIEYRTNKILETTQDVFIGGLLVGKVFEAKFKESESNFWVFNESPQFVTDDEDESRKNGTYDDSTKEKAVLSSFSYLKKGGELKIKEEFLIGRAGWEKLLEKDTREFGDFLCENITFFFYLGSEIDLSGLDLSEVDLEALNLDTAHDLTGILNLDGCIFKSDNLYMADLRGASIKGASFVGDTKYINFGA